ncbi:MFS transporter [uncultured Secundilactobacillus sp.]|uniref:MFS transporter n=1 Tax=uncultured Secundilactobacillus sp. TaxID=2813935 RepID=UPI00258A9C3F|nr:MFS transporter [uncultured Secundilactobacillus sp.]
MSQLRRWIILSTLGLFFFMVIVDGSIVTIAVPAISQGLNVSSGQVNLIIILYLVVICATLLTFGQLGDQIGRVRLFRWGTVVFLAGSVAAGWGINFDFVLVGRLFQGLGAGMTMANSYAIVADTFPPGMLGRALGIESIFISLGALAGPGLGGLILTVSSWHFIFWVNVPIGLICLVFEWYLFPSTKAASRANIDWRGSLWLVVVAISFYLVAQTLLQTPLIAAGFLMVSIGGGIGFYRAERRVANPLLNFAIFANQVFTRSLMASMLSFIAAYFFTLLAPLYLQEVLHYPSQLTGVILMVSPVMAIVANPVAGWLTDRYRPIRLMQAGMGLLVLAEVALVLANGHWEPWWLIVVSILLAWATAGFGTPSNTLIMSSAPVSQRGMVGATNSLVREFGMVIGATLATAVYYGVLSLNRGRRITTVVDQPASSLIQAQAVAYGVATVLLLIAAWLIRTKKMAR